MKFISYLTLAVVALALPFGNAFGMAQKTPSAQPNRYDRILEIIRTSAAKRDAANVKGKAGMQKGQKDVDEAPLYKGIAAGPESTQEFGTAATLAGKTMQTAQGTKTMRTALQTQQFNTAQGTQQFKTAQGTQAYKTAQQTQQFDTALQTGVLPQFKTAREETQFLTALQDQVRAARVDDTLPAGQGWGDYIRERLAWLIGHPYGNPE